MALSAVAAAWKLSVRTEAVSTQYHLTVAEVACSKLANLLHSVLCAARPLSWSIFSQKGGHGTVHSTEDSCCAISAQVATQDVQAIVCCFRHLPKLLSL